MPYVIVAKFSAKEKQKSRNKQGVLECKLFLNPFKKIFGYTIFTSSHTQSVSHDLHHVRVKILLGVLQCDN